MQQNSSLILEVSSLLSPELSKIVKDKLRCLIKGKGEMRLDESVFQLQH